MAARAMASERIRFGPVSVPVKPHVGTQAMKLPVRPLAAAAGPHRGRRG